MLKDIVCQIINGSPVPFSEEAKEQLASFKENQVILIDARGTTKERSIIQLRLYWVLCKQVALNVKEYPFGHEKYADYILWSSKKLVDKQVRKALHFVDDSLTVRIDKNTFEFHYRSISFRNLRHMDACDFFNRAFEVMAARLGLANKEELIRRAA